MSDETRTEFVDYIAKNPLSGAIIPGTKGARKIRWQADAHKGKSSGARVIYYFHNKNMPIFLFTAYKKGVKEDLTQSEKKMVGQIIQSIVENYEVSDE